MTPPSVEWSKKAYVFNPHDRGLVLSEESEENILVNLHGLLGEPDAVQIEIASENLQDADALIISGQYYLDHRDVVREFVRQGGGALLTYDAAGSGRPLSDGSVKNTFP